MMACLSPSLQNFYTGCPRSPNKRRESNQHLDSALSGRRSIWCERGNEHQRAAMRTVCLLVMRPHVYQIGYSP